MVWKDSFLSLDSKPLLSFGVYIFCMVLFIYFILFFVPGCGRFLPEAVFVLHCLLVLGLLLFLLPSARPLEPRAQMLGKDMLELLLW